MLRYTKLCSGRKSNSNTCMKKKWIFCEPYLSKQCVHKHGIYPLTNIDRGKKTCFYNRLSNGIRSVFGLCFPTNPMALRVMSVHRVDAPSSSIVTVALEDYAMWEPVNCLETVAESSLAAKHDSSIRLYSLASGISLRLCIDICQFNFLSLTDI